jgi:hypothetical protein
MARDAASINFNVTVPNTVIKTYFEGLAKVEASRASSSYSTSYLDQLAPLVPLLVPLLSNLCKSNDCSDGCGCSCEYSSKSKKDNDSKPFSFKIAINKDDGQETTSDDSDEVRESDGKSEVKNCAESQCDVAKDLAKEAKKTDSKKEYTPSYSDDDNSTVQGGLNEFVKMLGPMMEGLMNGGGGDVSLMSNMFNPKNKSAKSTVDDTTKGDKENDKKDVDENNRKKKEKADEGLNTQEKNKSDQDQNKSDTTDKVFC